MPNRTARRLVATLAAVAATAVIAGPASADPPVGITWDKFAGDFSCGAGISLREPPDEVWHFTSEFNPSVANQQFREFCAKGDGKLTVRVDVIKAP